MKIIQTDKAPTPAGHYSQAIEHQGVLYISGQLPIDPAGNKVNGPIEVQMQQVLENMEAIARAAGASRSHVIRVTIYVSDIALWDRINAVYTSFFGDHKPARAVVPTRDLHYGLLVELSAEVAVPHR